MDAYVYSRIAPPGALRTLLSDAQAKLEYLMQESTSDITFARFSPPGEDWQPWDNGRAFGPEVEVRWQRVDDGMFQLLVLSEVPQEGLVGDDWRRRENMQAEDGGRIYLWGRHWSFLAGKKEGNTDHGWVQASIPRSLHYPLEAVKEFAYIETVNYSQQGMIVLTRFRSLRGEDGKEAER